MKIILGNLAIWCCVTALALGLMRSLSAPEASARIPPLPPSEVLAPLQIVWPDARSFTSIAERPLFTPGRRPPAPVTPVRGSRSKPAITLVGIIATQRENVAIATMSGETVRLRPDDTVAGWSVIAIDSKSMTLRQGRDEFRVWLGDQKDTTDEPKADERQLTRAERRLATFGSAGQNQFGADE